MSTSNETANASSLPTETARPFPIGVVDGLLLFVMYYVIDLVVTLLMGHIALQVDPFHITVTDPPPLETYQRRITSELATLGGLWLYLRYRGLDWGTIGLRRCRFWSGVGFIAYGWIVSRVLAVMVMLPVAILFPQAFASRDPYEVNLDFEQHMASHMPIWAALSGCVLTPIMEECLTRGVLFPALARRWGVSAGGVLSSLVFVALHTRGTAMLALFVLGLVYCGMLQGSRSLWPGIGLHALQNANALRLFDSLSRWLTPAPP
jgi:membrane protease YdiL (CAAX protease family)